MHDISGYYAIICQKRKNWKTFQFLSASPGGFEPPTFRLGGGRSIQLSYGDNNSRLNYTKLFDEYH